jgi:hypothetical protein
MRQRTERITRRRNADLTKPSVLLRGHESPTVLADTLVRAGWQNCRPGSKPSYQAKYTEKTNGESTPPAITSFSPARSDASSMRK